MMFESLGNFEGGPLPQKSTNVLVHSAQEAQALETPVGLSESIFSVEIYCTT